MQMFYQPQLIKKGMRGTIAIIVDREKSRVLYKALDEIRELKYAEDILSLRLFR